MCVTKWTVLVNFTEMFDFFGFFWRNLYEIIELYDSKFISS